MDDCMIDENQLEPRKLVHVLSKMLGVEVIRASCRNVQLQGGTLGDVRLVEGMAVTVGGEELPYKVVHKSQKKWERPGDPDSWRREYDLYMSDFGKVFTDSMRWPECYHAQMDDDEIHLWIEYVEGISGSKLDIGMIEFAAEELGRFQGRLCKHPEMLVGMDFLSTPDMLRKNYEQWHTQTFSYDFLTSDRCRLPEFLKHMLKSGKIRLCDGKTLEYGYLRSEGCSIPEHLKQMIFDIDDSKDAVFNSLKCLPVVLCHRDYWAENIFMSDGRLRIIDWDSAGVGYLGEDIASLICDDTETENLHEYCRRLIPAYLKGLSGCIEVPLGFGKYAWELMLIMFGYRMVQDHMFAESPADKEGHVERLQKIYEMKDILNV